MGQRFAGAQAPAPKKSNALRTILVITACIILVAALGAGGWIGYSKYKARQQALKGNPAAMVTPPTATQSNNALDILAKVQNAYTNLSSLTISGTSVMALDMSQLTAADLNPNAKKTAKTKKTRRPAGMPKAITNTTDVVIKLERPNLYCMEGTSKMSMGGITMSNKMAAWSSGDTNYTLMIMSGGAYKRYTAVKDRNTALMQGGQTGGLAVGIMDIFFNDSPNGMDRFIQDWGQTADDSVNGQDCYTLTGKIFGQKLEMWISKSSYMILQSQITLGAPVSNEDVDNAIDTFDTNTNQAQIAKDKAQAEQQAAMMTKLSGTLTDTYDDIQTNPPLTADDFHYQVPRGVRLVVQ